MPDPSADCLVQVALNLPIPQLYTYTVPEELAHLAQQGKRVWVPFGRRKQIGIITAVPPNNGDPATPNFRLKPIEGFVDNRPVLNDGQFRLAEWIAGFYACSLGEVLHKMCPPEGSARLGHSSPGNRSKAQDTDPDSLPSPTDEQEAAIQAVTTGAHKRILLHGITGSGKTEVYLRSAEYVLSQGKQVLVLVPEISLTSQLYRGFRARFGKCVTMIHSGLRGQVRPTNYFGLLDHATEIVVGARSAALVPFHHLGLIIVDEEHEASYKSGDAPRYHARQTALHLGRQWNAPVILGSATPSVETAYFAGMGRTSNESTSPGTGVEHQAEPGIKLFQLRKRHGNAMLPHFRTVDLRSTTHTGLITPALKKAVTDRLEKGEQVIMLLNKRGYAHLYFCDACGTPKGCPNCDVKLTFHKVGARLVCHYCGFMAGLPRQCASCGHVGFDSTGFGTQHIEEDLQSFFPTARLGRLDRDTTSRKGSHEQILGDMAAGNIDILLGTQMVAKGLHFPNVTLSAILLADLTLNQPDFRAAERTFQIVGQTGGRAGRGEIPGEVIVQTYRPDHFALTTAMNGDYEGFLHAELALRQRWRYPPFCRLLRILIRADDEAAADEIAGEVARAVRTSESDVIVLGPAPAYPAFMQRRHRRQIVIKGESRASFDSCIVLARKAFGTRRGAYLEIDVDPVAGV